MVTKSEIGTKFVKSKIQVKNDWTQIRAALALSQLGESPSGNCIR